MTDLIATLVVIVVLAAAVVYIVRQKKAGVKCVGCSVGQACADRSKAQRADDCGCSCGVVVDQVISDMEAAAK